MGTGSMPWVSGGTLLCRRKRGSKVAHCLMQLLSSSPRCFLGLSSSSKARLTADTIDLSTLHGSAPQRGRSRFSEQFESMAVVFRLNSEVEGRCVIVSRAHLLVSNLCQFGGATVPPCAVFVAEPL